MTWSWGIPFFRSLFLVEYTSLCVPEQGSEGDRMSIAYYGSPFGLIRIREEGGSVTQIRFTEREPEKEDGEAEALTRYRACGPGEGPDFRTGDPSEVCDEAAKQLRQYFLGSRTEFDFQVSLEGTDFQKKVWMALAQIPYGETRSYRQIAEAAGTPKGAHAVGAAIGKNPIMVAIPCHRAIGSNGDLTGYRGGLPMKKILLDLESRHSGTKNAQLYFAGFGPGENPEEGGGKESSAVIRKPEVKIPDDPAVVKPQEREALAWKHVKSDHVVRDRWIDFRSSQFLLPDGQEIGPFYNFTRQDFIVLAARTKEGRYICVRQFRQGIRDVTTEFPAGGIEAGETPLEAAARELREETGYRAARMTVLLRTPAAPTISSNMATVILAEGCRPATDTDPDPYEFLETVELRAEDIRHMIRYGSFQQPLHGLAFCLAEEAFAEGRA